MYFNIMYIVNFFQGYIERLETCNELTEKQMSDLFGNLKQIYTFNRRVD